MVSIFLTEARFYDEKAAGDSYHSVFEDDIFAVSDLGSGRGSRAFNPKVGQHFSRRTRKKEREPPSGIFLGVFEGRQKPNKMVNSSPLKLTEGCPAGAAQSLLAHFFWLHAISGLVALVLGRCVLVLQDGQEIYARLPALPGYVSGFASAM